VAHSFASRAALLACTMIVAASAAAAPAGNPTPTSPRATPIVLVPHRAIYDLSLANTRGNSQIIGVRGRILYDFDGNACEGYTLQFRQVSLLDSGEGKVATSDLRATTWEGGDAKSFKFSSENFLDDKLVDSVDGRAERGSGATAVNLKKPESKVLDLGAAVVFPTEHMVRAIAAARAGQNLLDFAVFDGSDTGDKVYDTLTVIGRKLAAGERKHDDAADDETKLADVPRWPVTISYFERDNKPKTGEQTPTYAIGFELYDNGISRALSLDYNDFIVAGKLTSLEIKEPKPCP
jgi:hypothetical protein